MTRNQLDTIFTAYAAPGNGIALPRLILLLIRALIRKSVELAGVPTTAAPTTAPSTKSTLLLFVHGLADSAAYKLSLRTTVIRFIEVLIRRYAVETIVNTTPVEAVAYDSTLTGPSQTLYFITLTSAGGERLKFNRLTTGTSAPANMQVWFNNVQVASVDLYDRYLGRPFQFLTAAGVTYSGTFASGRVNVS